MILLISFKLTYIKVIYIIQPNRPEQHLSLLQASTTTKIPPDEISPLCVDYFTGGIFIINKGILYFLTPLNTFAIMQVALLQFLLQFLDQFKVISVFHLRESFDDSTLAKYSMVCDGTGQFIKLCLKLCFFHAKHFNRFFLLGGCCLKEFCFCKCSLYLTFTDLLCSVDRGRCQSITEFVAYDPQI